MDPDYLAKFLAAVDATNEPNPTVPHRIRKAIAAHDDAGLLEDIAKHGIGVTIMTEDGVKALRHDDVLAMTYTNICIGCGETMPVERELLVCEKCEAGEATPAYNSR